MRMRLRCLMALGVWLMHSRTDALRSCSKNGQVRVPCEDDLLLGKSDRFLLTLYGHMCYTMHIASPVPLEVLFYDSRDLKSSQRSDQSVRALELEDASTETTHGTNETVNSLAALGDNRACHNVLSCVQLQEGLSKSTVYNLMISRWSNASADATKEELDQDQDDGPIRVAVLLEHCDPVSAWHYVGLVFVGSIGFTSTMLLFCIVGEFVLGLRTITKLQSAAQRDRFVELAQIDPQRVKRSGKEGEEVEEDPEEPTAPLMTTVIPTDVQTDAESEKSSPA